MVAYHLDRENTLRESSDIVLIKTNSGFDDSVISFYGFDSVSSWGFQIYQHLLSPNFANFRFLSTFHLELQAESIRKQFYPDKPSRFKSIFAVKNLSDFKLWKDPLPVNNESHIYEIEYDSSQCALLDAYFLKGGIGCDPFTEIQNLLKYWSGQLSDNPLPELLIPLPVSTGKCLSPAEIVF